MSVDFPQPEGPIMRGDVVLEDVDRHVRDREAVSIADAHVLHAKDRFLGAGVPLLSVAGVRGGRGEVDTGGSPMLLGARLFAVSH